MRIGIVVQRFGPGVEGGAEKHCEMVAQRLAERHEVEILTTTVLDAGQWHRNHFPAEVTEFSGLKVRRFRVENRRGPLGLARRVLSSRRLLGRSESLDMAWLLASGPTSPDLMRWLEEERAHYDAFLFFTYLYPTTALGLLRVADRAVLVPTAHDEPALRRECFRPLFLAPRAIIYNTDEERRVVETVFQNQFVRSWTAGVGIEAPEDAPQCAERSQDIVYMGRIVDAKVGQLVPWFIRWAEARGHRGKLHLLGKPYMRVPSHPQVLTPGYVSEAEKWRRLANARAFVLPSRFESLSMVLLEAWTVGTPTLVNGDAEVLKGHIDKSGGGFAYTRYEEFAQALDTFMDQPARAAEMGQKGQRYVESNYSWAAVLPKIEAALQHAAS